MIDSVCQQGVSECNSDLKYMKWVSMASDIALISYLPPPRGENKRKNSDSKNMRSDTLKYPPDLCKKKYA